MFMDIGIANGNGTCQKCNKFIDKDEKQVVVNGFRSSARWHIGCVLKLIKESGTKMIWYKNNKLQL